jgi:hypothetical protein
MDILIDPNLAAADDSATNSNNKVTKDLPLKTDRSHASTSKQLDKGHITSIGGSGGSGDVVEDNWVGSERWDDKMIRSKDGMSLDDLPDDYSEKIHVIILK